MIPAWLACDARAIRARISRLTSAMIRETAVRSAALPLRHERDLDPLIDAIGDARFVLLGEATHGTSEFYTWRTEISKRLIRDHGFSFIAVEGDWPDCYQLNRFVKSFPGAPKTAEEALRVFRRWPTWMWANRETAALLEWLRARNAPLPEERRAGFFGLDVYSLWESMDEVVRYLDRIDPEAARSARRAYACFEPFAEDAQEYARATAIVPTTCEDEAVTILRALRARAPAYREDGRDAFFAAEQNALVARNAEVCYRTMVRSGPSSWNVRDYHMADTLDRLMTHHGDRSRAIVWEHNTHIGDARFTDMARQGLVNVGELARQRHDREGVVLVGFGTYEGSVVAGEEWGEPMRRMRVPRARDGSWEDALHRGVGDDALFIFNGADDGGVPGLDEPIPHRAIGVVYDPDRERWGNYVPSIVPRRYDAFIHIERSRAVDALDLPVVRDGELPETFPSGE